ncbi:hypothetical protein [Brevibacillus borstelensis]|uniref:hypothetical protein n=1 Tax=Brevibacillus borstelensis TaxID=45462 RepID=UPI0004698139|nr:hypothetical protein [Brevibacillus borstelensis]MCC0567485.1 hypothetical protein [Brevibacillus borstelensis]MCM3473655.1 hypothetical protein [Brevibacillus borstelensis]MCM3561917.1 hypothetical protein [Brevibacillus borstelensis]MCM3594024.1 hypothetical protein [Brevibacillus borstelensis]MED1853575.1 hypothetical protein [Brevibacillus borstelensis]
MDLLERIIKESGLEKKIIAFKTQKPPNHFTVEWNVKSLLWHIDGACAKQILGKLIDKFPYEAKQTVSRCFSSDRTSLVYGSEVITLVNIDKAQREFELFLNKNEIQDKQYQKDTAYLFYMLFVIESKMINDLYRDLPFVEKNTTLSPDMYMNVANFSLQYYTQTYGSEADIDFAVDYFFHRFPNYVFAYKENFTFETILQHA